MDQNSYTQVHPYRRPQREVETLARAGLYTTDASWRVHTHTWISPLVPSLSRHQH